MRTFIHVAFWTIAVILALPAVLGMAAGLVLLGVAVLLSIVVVAAVIVCLMPVIWWCAIFDKNRAYAYATKLQTFTRHQTPEGN